MDYLPIQASSVPCERVFSSSGETDTVKRNRLATDLFEALQLRKYRLKTDRLDFVKHWITPVTDLTPDDDEDVHT
jgi:hAT family C-terminal dimerisation region